MPSMSDHYEIVISCFLRHDTPEAVLAAWRWHLGSDPDCPDDLSEEEHPWPLFLQYPGSRLPGGDSATQRRSESMTDRDGNDVWELYARNYWVDDNLPLLDPLLRMLAPHVALPGYGGHLRHEGATELTIIEFRDGGHTPVRI